MPSIEAMLITLPGLSWDAAARSGDTSFLSVRRDAFAVCLHREEGAYPIRTHALEVGDRHPLGVGGGSLAILATLSDAEIERVLPDGGTVHLLGGPQALTSAVERALDDLGYRTPRFPGADRIQTAGMIARFVGASASDEVLLVRAAGNPDLQQGWVDSVSCGGWAADTATPVLLTHTESPTVADESLRTKGYRRWVRSKLATGVRAGSRARARTTEQSWASHATRHVDMATSRGR